MKSNKNIKEGYKKTAVGVIPEEWEVKKLKSQIDIDKENLNTSFNEEYINYVSLSDIENGRIYPTRIEFKNAPSRARRITKKGDVLLATVRPNLKNFGFVDQDNVIASTGFAVLSEKRMDMRYLYNFLYSEVAEKQFYAQTVGSNYPALNSSDVKNLKLPIPPLPEQQAIANCLTTWDSGIEKLTQLIAAKREQKKGLMQQLLTGKKRLDGFVGEWKEVKLNEIAKRVTRKNKELNDTVITISAQRGLVLQEDFFNKRVASATLSNYYLLHKGEFAYNKSYSKGYPMGAFKRLDDFEKAVVTTLYICFKIKDNVNSDFLMNFFEAGLMVNNLMRIAQEGGRAHGLLNIGLADFFNLKLNIPSFEEQTAIAHILTTADQEISLLEAKLAAMKEEKKGLMQVLLTGEKRLVESC